MVKVTPIDGWGFRESVDGKLARSFEIEVLESGVKFAPDVIGWKAKALNGKYKGSHVKVTLRHIDDPSAVVLEVFSTDSEQGTLFSGMADTTGLKRDWL